MQADDSVAQVVCRMMGKSGGKVHLGSAQNYGKPDDKIPVIANRFICQGDEPSIFDCQFEVHYGMGLGLGTCGHSEDLSITCT